jgi:hypothetical protein
LGVGGGVGDWPGGYGEAFLVEFLDGFDGATRDAAERSTGDV